MLRYLIIIGNILVCNNILLISCFNDAEAAFTRITTSLPLLKTIALAFSLGFTTI